MRQLSRIPGGLAMRRNAIKHAGSMYRANPRLAYYLCWLYPVSIVAPGSFSLPLANALTLPRLFLFMTLFATVREMWRKLTTGGYVPIASDLMVILMAAWMVATMVIHHGGKGLINYGSLTAIEFLAAYFLARAFFGTLAGFYQFMSVMRVVVVLIVISALLDTVTGFNFMSRLGSQLSGSLPAETFPKRFGLIRAQGSLEHPILLGIFFVLSAVMFYYSNFKPMGKLFWIGVCLFGVLLPLSSAPLLSLTMAFSLIFLFATLEKWPWGVYAIVALGCFYVGSFFLLVDDPIVALINNLTLDPQTGIFRTLIWKWAIINIERVPWLGIGMEDWMRAEGMPPSIDSLYLVQAVRHGLPALVLLSLAVLTTGVTLFSKSTAIYNNPDISRLRTGLGVCVFVICFNAFTVHFWGVDWVLLAIILGSRAGVTESLYLRPWSRGENIPASPAPGTAQSRGLPAMAMVNHPANDQAR